MFLTKKILFRSIFLIFVCGLFLCSCKEQETEIFMEHVEQSSEEKQDPEPSKENSAKIEFIWIDVSGAVNVPGVYKLQENARLFEAIEAAGGFTEEADSQWLNQASILQDGEKIQVYTKDETKAMAETQEAESQNMAEQEMEQAGKINLNTATLETLQKIPGIGEVRAKAILDYRKKIGKFQSIEDIQQVSGIKGKTYEKIADYICVN